MAPMAAPQTAYLRATFLCLRILKTICSSTYSTVGVMQNLVYSHPTIAQISAFLAGPLSGKVVDTSNPEEFINSLVVLK
jgi:hypothetical protein